MVSKMIKKTPTKSIKKTPVRRRKRTPQNAAVSAALLTTLNKSLLTCRRRLIKFFSKLGTNQETPHKHTYQLLDTIPKPNLNPTLPFSHKKTIFLDLDETLIHSKPNPPPQTYDFIVKPKIDNEILTFYVSKRPGLNTFLEKISNKYEVVVFTAGIKEYASLVIDRIDEKKVIAHRLYRDSCKEMEGGNKYVKDLRTLGREMESVVIIDDNPNAVVLNVENAILIKPFVGEMEDDELDKLGSFLGEKCDEFGDMREAVKMYVGEEGVLDDVV